MRLKDFRSRGRNTNVFEDDELLEEEFNQGELGEEEIEVVEAPTPPRERREVARKPKKGRSLLLIIVGIVAIGILLFVAFPPKSESPPLLPAGVAQTSEEGQAITQKSVQILAGVRKCPNSDLQEPCFGDLTWEEVLATGVPEKDAVLLGGIFEVTAESPENYSIEIRVPSCSENCSAGTAWVPAPAGFVFGQPIIAEAIPETATTPEIPQPKPQPTAGIISPKVKFWGVIILCVAVFVFAFVRYVRSGRNVVTVEQGYVSFVDRLGRFNRSLEPGGPYPIVPVLERIRATVDIRVQRFDFENLQLTTKDGFTVFVSAEVYGQVIDPEQLVYHTNLDPTKLKPSFESALASVVQTTTFEDLRATQGVVIEEANGRLDPLNRTLGELGIKAKRVTFSQVKPTPEVARYLEEREQAKIEADATRTRAKGQQDAAEMIAQGSASLITAAIKACRRARIPITAPKIVAMVEALADFQATSTGVERVIVTGGRGGGMAAEVMAATAALSQTPQTDEIARRVLELLEEKGLVVVKESIKERTIEEE